MLNKHRWSLTNSIFFKLFFFPQCLNWNWCHATPGSGCLLGQNPQRCCCNPHKVVAVCDPVRLVWKNWRTGLDWVANNDGLQTASRTAWLLTSSSRLNGRRGLSYFRWSVFTCRRSSPARSSCLRSARRPPRSAAGPGCRPGRWSWRHPATGWPAGSDPPCHDFPWCL